MKSITSLGSFAVKNDGSEDFKTYVLEPLNEIWRKDENYNGDFDGNAHNGHYGIDINSGKAAAYIGKHTFQRILTVSQVKEFLTGEGKVFLPEGINEHKLTDKISTHIRQGFDGWQAGFTVQQQTFYLQPVSCDKGDKDDTKERAIWYQGCLETALNKVIKNEYETLYHE